MRVISALLSLGISLSANAETIRERFLQDSGIQLYTVIFAITQNPDGTVRESRVAKVTDVRNRSTDAVKIDIPAGYLAKADKAIREHKYELHEKDGRPVEFYTYYFYSPQLGDRLIDDVNSTFPTK